MNIGSTFCRIIPVSNFSSYVYVLVVGSSSYIRVCRYLISAIFAICEYLAGIGVVFLHILPCCSDSSIYHLLF